MKKLLFSAVLLSLSACSKEAPVEPESTMANAPPATPAQESPGLEAPASEDPYLWLEAVEGEKALAWVEEQNAVSLAYLEGLPNFDSLFQRNLEIYNSDERIPTPGLRGG